MTTIIRVKRHRGEDPVEALVLSCKRKRTENNESDSQLCSVKYVLNFSGTVEEKDDKVAASTVESYKNSSKYSDFTNKEHIPDIKSKKRKEWKERSDDSRFTLLSCLRSNSGFDNNAEAKLPNDIQISVTIVDVSRENNNDPSALNTNEDSFVYDLYSTNVECDSDYNDMFMEHLLSVQTFQNELDYRNGEDCSDEIDPDEDDSNDENNWRNDYPDSDIYEDEDEDEDDCDKDILASQLKRFHIDDQNYDESSSGSEDEEYMNYCDLEKYCYYEAEGLAGKRYARYKANALKQIMKFEEGEEEEESDEEYIDCEDSFYENSD